MKNDKMYELQEPLNELGHIISEGKQAPTLRTQN